MGPQQTLVEWMNEHVKCFSEPGARSGAHGIAAEMAAAAVIPEFSAENSELPSCL